MIRDARTAALACAALLVSAALYALAAAAAPGAIPANAPSVFAPDKGKFRITINGQQVGTEEFSISPSGDEWVASGAMSAHATSGPEIKSKGLLRLAADGSPVHYEWSAEAQKKATGSVEFSAGSAKCSADFGGPNPMRKDFTFNSSRIAVLDNNLYYQYAVLAREYDWKAGGKQTFPVLIPQDMVPGSISVESVGPQAAGTGSNEVLRASTPDLEILLHLDGSHRLIRLDVPSSNAVIERE